MPFPAGDFGKLKKAQCPACGSKDNLCGELPKPTNDGDAIGWLTNGDTGISSMTIWSVMMGKKPKRADVPYDPDDFGRCYRLLKVMPSWRPRLGEVSAAFPVWAGLVGAWDELTALYERDVSTGTCKALYDRMRVLRGRT